MFGSQKGVSVTYNSGNQLGPDYDLRRPYGVPLSLSNGLPHIKYEYRVLLIDVDKIEAKVNNSSNMFYKATQSSVKGLEISNGKTWCNDTDLGPTSGLGTISRGANQFTWTDSAHLLISHYQGLILKYKLLD